MDAATVIEQMLAVGMDCPPQPLDTSGKVRRFGRNKSSWYSLRELRTDGGRWVIVGAFGDWRTQVRERVAVDWAGIGADERAALLEQQLAREQARHVERQAEIARASMSAAELWRSAATEGRSAYLARKGVQAEGCRYLPDGSIVVPLLRYDLPRDQAVRGVQRIWADGRKRFTRGFDKPGCALRLGSPVGAAGAPLLLCEGYATGLTLREATGRTVPVFVGLDAGNLLPVVLVLRGLYPASRILICADDDWRTTGPDGQPLNVGRVKALQAARAAGNCDVLHPVWPTDTRAEKDTDFNDLHQRVGLEAVRRQVGWVLAYLMEHAHAA